jgi:hypothetical protein
MGIHGKFSNRLTPWNKQWRWLPVVMGSSVTGCLMFLFFLDCGLLLCQRLLLVTTLLGWEVHYEHPGEFTLFCCRSVVQQ